MDADHTGDGDHKNETVQVMLRLALWHGDRSMLEMYCTYSTVTLFETALNRWILFISHLNTKNPL